MGDGDDGRGIRVWRRGWGMTQTNAIDRRWVCQSRYVLMHKHVQVKCATECEAQYADDLHNADIDALEHANRLLKQTVADREAEILRIQTHETAAAHALDCKLTPEERGKFKRLADRVADLERDIDRLRRIEARVLVAQADVNAMLGEGVEATNDT